MDDILQSATRLDRLPWSHDMYIWLIQSKPDIHLGRTNACNYIRIPCMHAHTCTRMHGRCDGEMLFEVLNVWILFLFNSQFEAKSYKMFIKYRLIFLSERFHWITWITCASLIGYIQTSNNVIGWFGGQFMDGSEYMFVYSFRFMNIWCGDSCFMYISHVWCMYTYIYLLAVPGRRWRPVMWCPVNADEHVCPCPETWNIEPSAILEVRVKATIPTLRKSSGHSSVNVTRTSTEKLN